MSDHLELDAFKQKEIGPKEPRTVEDEVCQIQHLVNAIILATDHMDHSEGSTVNYLARCIQERIKYLPVPDGPLAAAQAEYFGRVIEPNKS